MIHAPYSLKVIHEVPRAKIKSECIIVPLHLNDDCINPRITATVMCHRQIKTENQWVILEPYIGNMQNTFIKVTHGAGKP